MVGSLTGAVSSQKVTEERNGMLSVVGNHTGRVIAKACLTARPMGQAGEKSGYSDPVVLHGKAIAN